MANKALHWEAMERTGIAVGEPGRWATIIQPMDQNRLQSAFTFLYNLAVEIDQSHLLN